MFGVWGTGGWYGVFVSDGDLNETGTFHIDVLNVYQENNPPFFLLPLFDLSYLPDSGVHENVLYLPAFVRDLETWTQNLSYEIYSQSNTSIVDCSVRLNGFVDCMVQPGQTGFSNVTIQVSDGNLVRRDSFIVTVGESLPQNTKPVFVSLLPDLFLNESGFVDDLVFMPLYVQDSGTSALNLSYLMFGQNNTAVTRCSVDSTAFLDCFVEPGAVGLSVVTLLASDGVLNENDTLVVNVDDPYAGTDHPPFLWILLPDLSYLMIGSSENVLYLPAFFSDLRPINRLIVFYCKRIWRSVVDRVIDENKFLDCLVNQTNWYSAVTIEASDGVFVKQDSFIVGVDAVEKPNAAVFHPPLPDLYLNGRVLRILSLHAVVLQDSTGIEFGYNVWSNQHCCNEMFSRFDCILDCFVSRVQWA